MVHPDSVPRGKKKKSNQRMLCGYCVPFSGQHKLIYFSFDATKCYTGCNHYHPLERRECALDSVLLLFLIEHNFDILQQMEDVSWHACVQHVAYG